VQVHVQVSLITQAKVVAMRGGSIKTGLVRIDEQEFSRMAPHLLILVTETAIMPDRTKGGQT
jgi:hypothetical protein